MKRYPLDPFGIDCYLYDVEDSCIRQSSRFDYPFRPSAAVAPLRWYIATGRASAGWIRILLSIRPDVIARRLLQGGTDLEVMDRINNYLHTRKETTP